MDFLKHRYLFIIFSLVIIIGGITYGLITGYEYDIITSEIEKCLNNNNILTQINGDYTQVSNADIITLSNDYLTKANIYDYENEIVQINNNISYNSSDEVKELLGLDSVSLNYNLTLTKP